MGLYRVQNNTNLSMKGANAVATATSLLQEAVYWVDATAPRVNYPGYITLNGTQTITTPDSNTLDVTGDIDLRAKVALTDWTPTAINTLISKYITTGNQRSYRLTVQTSGVLQLDWSTLGTGASVITKQSSVATGLVDGSVKWVRATLDVDNGASGNDVKFFLSDDGVSWTQLGTTQTTAGTTSVFAGTAILELGASESGNFLIGNYYQAQIFASLDGSDKRLDVDLATNVTSATMTTFTATTGQLCTINGQDTVTNGGTAGALLPTTLGSSTAADSNDPKFLDHTGTNYVYLPGVASNGLSVPDAAALDITGDIDLRAYVAADDWTPSAAMDLITKRNLNNESYGLRLNTTGALIMSYSTDGTTLLTATSTATITVADGSQLWTRATRVASTGVIKFFTSTDGTSWTQLGTDVAGTSGNLFSGTANVNIGGRWDLGANNLAGKVFRTQIFSDTTGTTKVLDVDTSVITAGSATSFTAVTGQTVTINRSTSGRKTVAVTQPTWLFGTDDYMEVNNRYMSSGTYLYLPGVASNNATSPDSAALDITGDLDVRVKVAMDDWTPAATQALTAKYNTTGNQRSWRLEVSTTGNLAYVWSVDGITPITANSTVANGVADGATKWIRVIHDVDNGASGNDVKFYTSDDGTTWTQLGSTVTTAGTTSIYSGTALQEIGTYNAGSASAFRGKFFRAQVLNGINGTVAFDANFETSITSLNQTSFTESSANAATVTINRSGSAYRSAGITAAGYLYPGATNTFTASATDFLNFESADSFTVMVAARQWGNPTDFGRYLSKRFASGGYELRSAGTALRGNFFIGDKTTTVTRDAASTYTAGTLMNFQAVVNRSTQTVTFYQNTAPSTPSSISSVGSPSTSPQATVRIGSTPANDGYQDAEIYAAAVWRRRLLAPEIAALNTYFNARD